MLHLSELHGGVTHLAVVAIPVLPDRAAVPAGRRGRRRSGFGCASCHGDEAQGLRGPSVSGGAELGQFRRVHGDGPFPPAVVSDRDFTAVDAWLGTRRRGRRD